MGEIREVVMSEPLFDNHEHQHGFSATEREKADLDYRAVSGYADADMATARLEGSAAQVDADAYFDTWSFVRTTGYGQAAEMACRLLFDLDYSRETAEKVTEAVQRFVADRSGAEIYREIFSKANICGAVCDECWDSPTKLHFFTGREHPEFFGHALRYDAVIGVQTREQVQQFEQALDCSLQRLSDLDAALDAYTEKAREGGKLVAMKSAYAYSGHLRFENSSFSVAERVFEDIMQGRPTDRRPLADYLFHRFVQRAREFDLPVQLHTGYLAGNWGNPVQGDPAELVPVLQRYRNVRFDLFHAGWPRSEVIGAIGKAFPNVYLDMCWAWSMDPAAMERVLAEWLSAVPHNKIFAFGADTGMPYVVPGYAMQARRGIANVLERKVESGEYDLATAGQVARRIMHENAQELYGMG